MEGRERLAVITPDAAGAAALADPARRAAAVRLASAHGFTHLAVELPGAADAPPAPEAPPARAALRGA